MRKFGLIGHPLVHSRSQELFTARFKSEGIQAEYLNYSISTLDALTDIIANNPNLEGFNVTVPYKTSIIDLLDELSVESRLIQAVNTVTIDRTGPTVKLRGYNTDIIGFRKTVRPFLSGHAKALVLGTGGASKAAYHVLTELNIHCDLVSRDADTGDLSYDMLTPQAIADHDVIVNCTPVGMFPHTDEAPALPYQAITPGYLLFDMVYNPLETVFLTRGREQGATCVNGFSMLKHQAEESWKIWDSFYNRN